MALVETAGSAYIVAVTPFNTVTGASFSPNTGAPNLLCCMAGVGNGNGITPTGLTISSTFGGTATNVWFQLVIELEASGGAAAVWVMDAGSAATSGAVTVATAPTTVIDLGMIVRQWSGALPAAFQVAGAHTAAGGTIDTVSGTPIFTGSQFVGAYGAPVAGVVTYNGATTSYGTTSGQGGDSFGCFKGASLTTANTAQVLGYSATKATSGIAIAEILPATAVVYAIVGTIGAVDVGTSGAAITPSFGTGESRTAGNLLLCWVAGTGAATLPGTPSGWNVAVQQAGTSCSSTLFWKIAAGSDSAPTIALATGVLWTGQLAEFAVSSGSVPTSPVDQHGGAAGTTSPTVATSGSVDAATNELVCSISSTFYSAAATKPLNIDTINNGVTNRATSNAATSSAAHYNFGWGNTATNGAADSDSHAMTVTAITGNATAVVSFQLPSSGPTFIAPRPLVVGQAIKRGFW